MLKNKTLMVDSIVNEIRLQKHFFDFETEIKSIYFGGGTPSLLLTSEINTILNEINKNFKVDNSAEITLEANPDNLSIAYLNQLKTETSINRLSIGIQSFFEEDLKYMHRAHTASEAKQCIENAQNAGFHQLSVDLIYGTPTMGNELWKLNLQTVFDLQIPHISAYALTIEEKTSLAHNIKTKKISAPDEEQTVQQFSFLLSEMKKNGYMQYEISNFCKPPHFALHNTNYWKGIAYLGIGPSAHSFDGKKRYWNVANNAKYIKKLGLDELPNESETLSIQDQYNEYILTQIRTMWGIQLTVLHQRFGQEFSEHFLLEITPFISNNWVEVKNETYLLTDNGKLFCDYITENLFLQEE